MLKDGTVVTLHYRGTTDIGEVFDTSHGKRPRIYVIGRGQLLPGFEAALRTMSPGEKRTIRIEPDDAYGDHLDDRVYEVPREDAPEDLRVGHEVRLAGGAPAFVTRLTETTVRLDANHPLAGRALTFEIELLGAR